MADVYASALLVEQAAWEDGDDRKALVARLHARRRLAGPDPLRGIDAAPDEGLERFEELVAGTLIDDRPR